jgi:hypothetical protein
MHSNLHGMLWVREMFAAIPIHNILSDGYVINAKGQNIINIDVGTSRINLSNIAIV